MRNFLLNFKIFEPGKHFLFVFLEKQFKKMTTSITLQKESK